MSERKDTGFIPVYSPTSADTKDLILSLDKAVKAVKMYLPNNPQYQHFVDRTVKKFLDFFDSYPELRLEVKLYELLSNEEVVYRSGDRSSSIAFVLHKDGVREIIFTTGIEEWEIKAFLQAFNRDFTKEYLDDDLVTYFWEQSFKHIHYSATDEFVDEYLPTEIRKAADRQRAFIKKSEITEVEAADLKEAISTGTVSDEPGAKAPLCQAHLKSHFIPMTPEEKSRVKNLVSEDAAKHYYPVLIEAILNILKTETDYKSVVDLLDLLRKMLEMELSKCNFSTAAGFIKNISMITEGRQSCQPLVSKQAGEVLKYFTGDKFVNGLLAAAINSDLDYDMEQLSDFIAAMPVESTLNLLGLFEKIESMKVRKALCRGLAALIHEDIGAIVKGLEDSRWYVVRNTVFVLGMIKNPQATIYLKKILSHPDLRVRKEVIKTVFTLESADIDDYVLAALNDPDEKQRIFTLKNLSPRLGSEVKARIAKVVSSLDFKKKSKNERKNFYQALARIGNDEDLNVLENILKKKSWLRKDIIDEQRTIAQALAASESSKAGRILSKMVRDGKGSIKSICRKALESSKRSVKYKIEI